MFRSAATKIAHNTTIPGLAGELRPLHDLIMAEKSVLVSLNRLGTDLAKASEALKTWGQGEGDDLGDVLTASSAILAHFSGALSTWASLHHTIRDDMKAIRTREEALDDIRRRRKRVGASAEGASKKLSKMGSEHKNLGTQTDTLNKLQEEIRVLDGEILREEAALGDFKRKCTKSWMKLKFGGLVECCEKGTIVGNMGKSIVNEIPQDVTTPGFPRPPYGSRSLVSNYIQDTQHAISEVKFSGSPSGQRTPTLPAQTDAQDQPHLQHTASQFHVAPLDLSAPSVASGTGINMGRYDTQHSRTGSISVDGHGTHRFADEDSQPAKFSSLPNRREQVSVPLTHSPLSLSTLGNGIAGEEPSLMTSITDALSKSRRTVSIDQTTSIGHASTDPVPKYEAVTASEGHGCHEDRTNVGVTSGQKRATRRSTSPPVLPPGAAPAAIRAWDDGFSQGEDDAHSDRPASSSVRAPSQQRISSSEADGEEEDGLAYDRDDTSQKTGEAQDSDDIKSKVGGESFSESGREYDANVQMLVNAQQPQPPTAIAQTSVASPAQTPSSEPVFTYNPTFSKSSATMHSRSESQRRIPRVPPPALNCDPGNAGSPSLTLGDSSDGIRPTFDPNSDTGEPSEKHWRNVAAAREITRELDAFSASMATPVKSHLPPLGTPQQLQQEHPSPAFPWPSISPVQPPSQSPNESPLPSPLVPPNAPFANRSVSPVRSSRPAAERASPSYADGQTLLPSPYAASRGPLPHSPTSPRLPQLDTREAGVGSNSRQWSPLSRTPAEHLRPTPPFTSPLMAKSTSSLNSVGGGGGGAPRTISAAAFRRQQHHARSPGSSVIGVSSGLVEISPLMLRRQSPVPSVPSKNASPKRRLSVINPDPRTASDEEDLDNLAAHGAGEGAWADSGQGHVSHQTTVPSGAGYGAGKYVSELKYGDL